MEARKPKYSLFPAHPSSKSLSSIRHPSPPRRESSASASDVEEPPPKPPAEEPLYSEPHDPPASPEPSHRIYESAPPAPKHPESEPDSPKNPSEMTASSFSTASESSLKPAPLSVPSARQESWSRPKRAFIRHGLGGAGNYHKRPDSVPNSDYSGFLSALLGSFSNKKRKTRQYPGTDSTGWSQYSNQALPLGAAEVLKRKMLGQAPGGKRSTSIDRS